MAVRECFSRPARGDDVIVAKAIKPSPFRSSVFRDAVRAEAEAIRDEMFKDFDKTVKTWNHKPTFAGGVTVKGQQIAVEIKTDDEVYGYVTEGTKKHIIRPVRAKRLRFQKNYKAKTTPRVIGSKAGGPSGKEVFAKVVHHPGTKARKFHETIAKKWKPEFSKRMQAALNRAAKQSGQGKK